MQQALWTILSPMQAPDHWQLGLWPSACSNQVPAIALTLAEQPQGGHWPQVPRPNAHTFLQGHIFPGCDSPAPAVYFLRGCLGASNPISSFQLCLTVAPSVTSVYFRDTPMCLRMFMGMCLRMFPERLRPTLSVDGSTP